MFSFSFFLLCTRPYSSAIPIPVSHVIAIHEHSNERCSSLCNKSNVFFFWCFVRSFPSLVCIDLNSDKMASGQSFCKPICVYIGAAMFALCCLYVCVHINVLNMKEYYCDIYQCALALYP